MTKKLILKELSRYRIDTYADIIYRNALLCGSKEAFKCGRESVTFGRYNARVNSLVHGLYSMGLEKGDGIGILSWNCLECTDIHGAAMKGGFHVSPFNPRLQTGELRHLINYSEVKVLFTGPELIKEAERLREQLPNVKHFISLEESVDGMIFHNNLIHDFPADEPDADIREDDAFITFFTSGTTGVPRGAVYNHAGKLREAKNKALQAGLKSSDRHLMILPLFHIGGWSYFWALFCVGACNVIMPKGPFDPHATFKAIQEEKATDIHIVPTHLAVMLEAGNISQYDLSSIKRMWYAASPMPTELLLKGIATFGNVFAQGYGQSESGPDIAILSKESHRVLEKSPENQNILASCGQPCMGVHARIVDKNNSDVEPDIVGEIVIKSKEMMVEYWNRPEETRATIVDGWLHTGDMGYYDESGFIYIVDRKKDMIISGGENVYPREVEEILYQHPAVFEAVVIGVPDEKWVESVHAVVTLKHQQETTADKIIAFCKKHLAPYKAPKSVDLVNSLPKSPQGKILKRKLREKYWQGKKRKIS